MLPDEHGTRPITAARQPLGRRRRTSALPRQAQLACFSTVCLTHAPDALGHAPGEHASLWLAWSFDPWVAIPLLLAATLYAGGRMRLAAHARTGRREARLFYAGWIAAVLALLSPLDALGDALFSAHMVQHELLMLVAAPLLVLGKPLPVWLWALPATWRPGIAAASHARPWAWLWQTCTRPLGAWLIHFAVLWIWHAPPLFQAAVGDNAVHTLQHLGFMGSALLFWWAMFDPRHGLIRPALGALYIFTTALHTSVLGALLTFAERLWYPVYAETTQRFGLTPLEDQQLGGLIMWVPGGVVYLIVTLGLLARLLRSAAPATGRRPASTSAAHR